MAYDSGIPSGVNTVRGISGDLAKIKENFVVLAPVALSGISGLAGVALASPASGDVLRFDGADWVDGRSFLGELADVALAGPASGEIFGFDGADWVNQAAPPGTLAALSDTSVGGAASGELLGYDGGEWVNRAAPPGTLAGLSDTDVGGAASGEFLVYDGADWVNSGISGAFRGALVTLSGDLLISGGDTVSGVVFDREVYDSDDLFSGPSSGIIIPSGLSGSYVVLRGQAAWLTSGGVADSRGMYIKKDGADWDGMPLAWTSNRPAGGDKWLNAASAPVLVSGGEVFSLWVENLGSVALNLDAQRTWLSLEVSTVQIAGGGGGGAEFQGAQVYHISGIAGLSGAGFISWEAEDYDTDGFWDGGSPTRFTIPSGAGYAWARVGFSSSWGAEGNAGERSMSVFKNGALSGDGYRAPITDLPDVWYSGGSWSAWAPVSGGDYFEARYAIGGPAGSANMLSASWFAIEVREA